MMTVRKLLTSTVSYYSGSSSKYRSMHTYLHYLHTYTKYLNSIVSFYPIPFNETLGLCFFMGKICTAQAFVQHYCHFGKSQFSIHTFI